MIMQMKIKLHPNWRTILFRSCSNRANIIIAIGYGLLCGFVGQGEWLWFVALGAAISNLAPIVARIIDQGGLGDGH